MSEQMVIGLQPAGSMAEPERRVEKRTNSDTVFKKPTKKKAHMHMRSFP